MTRLGIVFEIEGTLFDVHALRVATLREAMAAEGVRIELETVSRAHRGVSASQALDRLAQHTDFDHTARELILLRSDDALRASLDVTLPSFDVAVRDTIVALAAESPMAVVTRATRALAQQLLAACELDALVNAIRSLADVPAGASVEQAMERWAGAAAALHADRCVAIAPLPMLEPARRAGLRTVGMVSDPDESHAGAHRPDATIVSFVDVNAALLAALP